MPRNNKKAAAAATATAIVPAVQTVDATTATVERPVSTLIAECFTENGCALTVRDDVEITPDEISRVILSREVSAEKNKTQARWVYYTSGLLKGGIETQENILRALKGKMTDTAIQQLKSEAMRNVPIALRNGFASPLSILKEAVAELKFDDGMKLLPDEKQTEAGKKLIPLLKAGSIKQAEVAVIRNLPSATKGGQRQTPNSAGTSGATAGQKETGSGSDNVGREFGEMLAHINSASEYLGRNKLIGDELVMAQTAVITLTRHVNLVVATPGAK